MVNLSRLLRGSSFMVAVALAVCSGCRNEAQGGQAPADAGLDGQPDGDIQSDPPAGAGPTDLAIAVVAGSDQAGIGGSVTYTITVTNLGSQMSADITVLDTVASGGAVSTAHGEGWSSSVAAQTVTCRRSGLGAGAASTITLEATMPTSVGPAANASSVSRALSDPVPDNNTASCSTNVVAAADLSLTQTASVDTVAFGANLTYTISVRNAGPATSTFINPVIYLPTSGTFVDATYSGGACTSQQGALNCVQDSMATGDTATISVRWLAPSSESAQLELEAQVFSSADPNSKNDDVTDDVTVVP